MMKNIKLASILAATLVLGGFYPVISNAQDKTSSVIDSLISFPGAQVVAPAPVTPAPVAVTFAEASDTRGNNNNGGNYSSTCKPSAALVPGKGFSPDIQDPVRVKAMNDLLAKIAACKPLPYSHDGITNTNTEGGMPQAAANFYKEYTLIVPGRNTGDGAVPVVIGGKTYMTGTMMSARGPERLIIGGSKEIYYTMDHYKSFVHLTIVK